MKVWDRAGIKLTTPGSPVRHASVARHITMLWLKIKFLITHSCLEICLLSIKIQITKIFTLTHNAPITRSRLLFLSAEMFKKPLWHTEWTLFWVHAVYFYTSFVSYVRQLYAADDFSRRHFQMHFFSWRFKG